MQFLSSGTNQRTTNTVAAWKTACASPSRCSPPWPRPSAAGRVGLRVCPGNPYNDSEDSDPAATAAALLDAIAPLGLAYLHVMRSPLPELDAFALARERFPGALILNDGFDGHSARQAIEAGQGEAVSFARHYIGNPDLAERLRVNAPLAGFDLTTLYSAGPRGYLDYPAAS